jgi:hypothetical protein
VHQFLARHKFGFAPRHAAPDRTERHTLPSQGSRSGCPAFPTLLCIRVFKRALRGKAGWDAAFPGSAFARVGGALFPVGPWDPGSRITIPVATVLAKTGPVPLLECRKKSAL